jgi:MalT-like TPR region
VIAIGTLARYDRPGPGPGRLRPAADREQRMNPVSDTAAQAAIGAAARELRLPTVRAQAARLAEIAAREHHTHLGYLAEVLSAELDAALRHVTEGIALCRRLIYVPPLAAGLVTLAWIRHAQGDAAGALNAIGEAGRVAPGEHPSLFNPVPVQRARLLLVQGDVAAAARWTQERGLRAGDEPPCHRESEYLLLARVLLAQDQPSKTLALLQRLHAAAAAQGRTGSIIEIQGLQALALAAGGDQDSAVIALAGVLTLACPQGYVRVFTDEGAPMGALLGRLVAAQRAEQGPARRPARLSGPAGALLRAGHRGHGTARGPAHARRRRPGRAAQRTRTGGAAIAGGRQAQPADSPGTGGVTAHRQKTRHPRPEQARRGQPHRGDRPRPRTRLAPLTCEHRTPLGALVGGSLQLAQRPVGTVSGTHTLRSELAASLGVWPSSHEHPVRPKAG